MYVSACVCVCTGCTLVAVFGLPPLAHENDPVRAVLSCLKMQQDLNKELAIRSSVGVTSGLALCGIIGSSGTRREYAGPSLSNSLALFLLLLCFLCFLSSVYKMWKETETERVVLARRYTVLGDVVNLSARLMQAANGRVLCDRDTHRAADSDPRLSFAQLPKLLVKGKKAAVEVFAPSWHAHDPEVFVPPRCKFTVGRAATLQLLAEAAEELVATGRGRTVLLLGEVGMGKSHLLRDCSYELGARLNLRPVWGQADAFNPSRHNVWRQVRRMRTRARARTHATGRGDGIVSRARCSGGCG